MGAIRGAVACPKRLKPLLTWPRDMKVRSIAWLGTRKYGFGLERVGCLGWVVNSKEKFDVSRACDWRTITANGILGAARSGFERMWINGAESRRHEVADEFGSGGRRR
jgi:hypothetical protein